VAYNAVVIRKYFVVFNKDGLILISNVYDANGKHFEHMTCCFANVNN